jgi:hypothetical protein
MDAAIRAEAARRNPDPIFADRTRAQIEDDLLGIKCDQADGAPSSRWSDVRVARRDNGHFDILPLVAGDDKGGGDDLAEVAYGRGRPRKQLSPYAQLYSWLRIMNWDLREGPAGIQDLNQWTRPGGELFQGIRDGTMTTAQRNALPASLRRFRRDVVGKSVGRRNSMQLFTDWIKTAGKMGGVGSLLPIDTDRAFDSQLCPFAQCIKVTKNLYVQVLVIKAKIHEVSNRVDCDGADFPSQDFIKRTHGIWGVFHRTCMPAIVYVRAWMEYFGLRLFGAPFGPLFFLNLWAYYVRNVLLGLDEKRRRRAVTDARTYLQQTAVTDFTLVLDPEALYRMIRREMRAAMPANQQALAGDPWDRTAQLPFMPGPPPEYTINHVLDQGWDTYLGALPQRWRNWLGTKQARNDRRHRYKQFTLDPVTNRVATSKGDDIEHSTMFRESGVCIVNRPARRTHYNPRAQRAVPPFLFSPPLLNLQMQQVQNIAMGVVAANPVQAVAGVGVGAGVNAAVQIALGVKQ